MENGLNALGRRIQVLRESNLMTRADMAQYIGVTRKDVVDWEEGRVLPTAQQVVDIAKLLNADPRSLLDAEETTRTAADAGTQTPAAPKNGRRLTAAVVCLALGLCAVFGSNFLMQALAVNAGQPAVSASAQAEELIPLPECLTLAVVETAAWDLDGDRELTLGDLVVLRLEKEKAISLTAVPMSYNLLQKLREALLREADREQR